MSRYLALGLVLALGFCFASRVRAAPPTRLYVLAIGYNGVPAGAADPRLRELRYADDDAAAFAQLAQDMGARVLVLSSFDADTTRRFPELSGALRPPMLDELRRSVRELNAAFEQDRKQGIEPSVLLTYSGHGVAEPGLAPSLTLADGELTQGALYNDVLAALQARFVHVVVDACHAAAVVRPRDLQAETVVLSPEEVKAHWSRATLDGLPNVGALVASSSSAQAHEWDSWQQGVFTHEVLSGLRGGADVNGDLKVEYSEMAAFLSAANREVDDGTVRVRALVKAPKAAPRVPIMEFGSAKASAFLIGEPALFGGVWVESENGHRVADVHSEQGQTVRLLVPSGRRLFVRNARGEAEVELAAGGRARLDGMRFRERVWHARGGAELSLSRGLFAATFGPAYYRGFVDYTGEWVAVPLRTQPGSPAVTARSDLDGGQYELLGWSAAGLSGALLITSGIAGIAALNAEADYEAAMQREAPSIEAADRYQTYGNVALGTLIGGVVSGVASYFLFTAQ